MKMTEDKITGLGHRPIEFTHFKLRKKFLKREQSLGDTWDNRKGPTFVSESLRQRGETECVSCCRTTETNNG